MGPGNPTNRYTVQITTNDHLVALNVRLGVDASLPVPEVERAVHLDDGLRLGAVVAQVALERGVLRVHLKKQGILYKTSFQRYSL